jgi:hypothetical protein
MANAAAATHDFDRPPACGFLRESHRDFNLIIGPCRGSSGLHTAAGRRVDFLPQFKNRTLETFSLHRAADCGKLKAG